MSEINEVKMSLQTRAHSLANFWYDFDTLCEAMNDASDN